MSWTDVCAADDLFDGASIAVVVDDREIALHTIDGVPYATDNACTHGAARLCEGFLDGFEIECPLHQGKFDVRSGAPTCAPADVVLRAYPVRIDGSRVFVQLGVG